MGIRDYLSKKSMSEFRVSEIRKILTALGRDWRNHKEIYDLIVKTYDLMNQIDEKIKETS
jgi:hypothetical protein